MKNLKIDMLQSIMAIFLISGEKPIGSNVTENHLGLLNESVGQGVKLRLRRILNSLNNVLADYNKSKAELFKEIAGEKEELKPSDPEYQKFIDLFTEVAKEQIEVSIDPIRESELFDIVTTTDYSWFIEKFCVKE